MPGYNVMREITPSRLGEPEMGEKDHDMDLHCKKFRVISVKMQEEEKIAEKKLHGEFVEEPVEEAHKRVWTSIPKNNLRIPFDWFDYPSDAAAFIKAVAKANNVGVHCFGKNTVGASLGFFMDDVWNHRHLRMKNEDDPPHMTLQERRIRHWKAVIANSCIARGFTLRLVRHVTLMLVGASFDFARQNGQRSQSSQLGGKIEKLREWFEENDLEDLKAFEFLQPERMPLNRQKAKVELRSNGNKKPDGRRPNSRKRKANAGQPYESLRPKRHRQTAPAAPPQRPANEFTLPMRITEGKRGKRNWNRRV